MTQNLFQAPLQKQTQTVSLQQQQSLRVLAMPAAELLEFVSSELESNPVLEPDDGFVELPLSGGTHDEESHPEPYESRRGQHADTTLQEELLFQLMTQSIDLAVGLGEHLIACLDDSGYLRMSDSELAAATGLPTETIAKAVAELQKLEPCGVFARNLSECLLLQLRQLPQRDPVAEQICDGYLELAAQNRLPAIAKALGCPPEAVREAFARIKTLNPKPGSGYFSERTHYIVPDIKVTVQQGELAVTSLTGGVVHINPYYTDRLPMVDDLTRDYLRGEITRGNGLIHCLEQRRRTLLAVARAAVDFQRGFFLSGQPLRPLTMAELASLLGVHESTVSRAASGKHLRYPGGTMPLGRLFCASLSDGGSVAGAKQAIVALVSQENKSAPLSDEKLTALLSKRGITLSRRAVAKYRDELGIASSQARKEW